MSREASMQELLNNSFAYHMNNVYTCLPGIIVTVRNNMSDMTVDVQPTLNIKNKNGSVEERPVIVNVPFHFPSSSTSAFTFPVNVGDPVMLAFSMRGLDTWKRGNGYPVTPTDYRKFDKRDCFAFTGFFPMAESINDPAKRSWSHDTNDTVIVHNIGESTETEIRLLKGGGIIINTNQDIEANCNNLTANVLTTTTINTTDLIIEASASVDLTAATAIIDCPTTTWTGDITHTGNITSMGDIVNIGSIVSNTVTLDTHLHDDTMPMVNAISGPPAPGT